MTLIVKEIIIKGIVTKDTSVHEEESLAKDEILRYLEQMQKLIKKDCIESVLDKLESKKIR